MTTYARIVNDVAVEIFTPPTNYTLAQCFHQSVAAQFTLVPDGTAVGSTLANSVWTPPVAQANQIPTLVSVQYPIMSAAAFYNCFTAKEMIAIKSSSDPLVKEFFARYQVALQSNEPINPNLVSVQEGVAYLAAPTNPGAGILSSESRIEQILSGVPQ